MKKIPQTYELDEEDIKKAIAYWLNHAEMDLSDDQKFDISFSVDRVAVAPPSGAPVGGMSDWTKQAVSVKAIRKE